MIPGARLSAAIEVLGVILEQRRPVSDVLREWGAVHRFAGSKDRAAIAGLVYDALRVRASAAWIMADESARGVLLGTLARMRGLSAEAVAELASGQGHAPAALTPGEAERLAAHRLDDAPDHVRGDYPEWLAPGFAAVFGDTAIAEGRALATRAPLDLRANTLKASRDKALRALSHLSATATPLSPTGLRVPLGPDGRTPPVSAEPAYLKGQVEIQDEGSQLAAMLSGVGAGDQVLDLCAGGGGKSLAMAGLMANKGQIYATDDDMRRLAPIHDRIARADARNIQVRTPRREQDVLADLEARCDVVMVDAPCTGTGTWRRHPDAKWRMRPSALGERCRDQDTVLAAAVRFLKPGGRLVYVTCSVLREENEDRIEALLAGRDDLAPVPVPHLLRQAELTTLADQVATDGLGLRLSPHRTGTDGFFVAALTRR